MLQILFYGTGSTLSKLQAALMSYAIVIVSGKADVVFCEVRNLDDLKRIPKNSPVPVFLLVVTREKSVIEQLKRHRINGIFMMPIDGDAIKNKLAAFVQIEQSNSNSLEMLKVRILAKAETISSLPIFARRLLSLTENDSATIREITDQIKMDQGISSRVIRMVNSPFYGLRQDVNSIDRAVVLLGFHTVKNIALVASTNMYYNKPFGMYHTTGAAMWQHAYVVAQLAEEYAIHTGQDTDTLFLAGLLHDIGKTVMVDFLTSPVEDTEEEVKQLGIDHAEVAAMIMSRWQFPPEVIHMVKYHHKPDDDLGALCIYCANTITHFAYNVNMLNQIIIKTVDRLPVVRKDELKERLLAIINESKEAS